MRDQSLSLLSASDSARDLETISTKPLQDVVDRLALEGFQGLNQWVASLDARCRAALRERTSDRLVRWALALEGAPIICDVEEETSVDVGCLRSRHCLVTSEHGIQLDPPVTQARLTLQAQVSSFDGRRSIFTALKSVALRRPQ